MSEHLENLKVGDSMMMKGPKGHLHYKGRGHLTIKHKQNQLHAHSKKKIGMVAGGTGITPMLQIIRAVMKDPLDKTEMWLLFGNQTENDILLRKELESIPKDRLHVFHTLERPPSENWEQGVGFVTTAMCKGHLPPAGPDSMILMCGPPIMMTSIQNNLLTLGYKESDFFVF